MTSLEPALRLPTLGRRRIVAAAIGFAVLLSAVGVYRQSAKYELLGSGLLALAGICYLGTFATPALLFSLALAAEALNGNAKQLPMHLPLAPDRILVAAAIGVMVMGMPGFRPTRSIVWRPVHVLLAATATYGAVSALSAHTLTQQSGLFAVLDRLGIVPFVAFGLAPLVFGTERARDTLLVVLVALGIYLGVTAWAEGLHVRWLVFPSYINDPSVGIHFGRARGPFAEAVADGLGLYQCAVASAVAWWLWRGRSYAPRFAMASALLCLSGTIFTLTRAVWLATLVATFVAMMANHRTRALLAPTLGIALAALALAIFLVPGFASSAGQRQSEQLPIWDRYNSNGAAVRAVEANPLFGVGFQAWTQKNTPYMRQSPNYPLTGSRIEIHNVLLSHAAELGLVGATLWIATFASGVLGAIGRRGPSDLDPWRLAMIAIAVDWFVVAMFGPLSYPFPNLFIWSWAGICSIGYTSAPREPVRRGRRTVRA
jgi:O-antigen ligase